MTDQSVFIRKGKQHTPPGLVLAPGGFRRESLTHFVPTGHRIRRRKGRLQLVERRTRRIVSIYEPVPADEPIPDIGSGWITYAWWLNNSGSPISQFSTEWVVPPEPRTSAQQTIFLFNALENAANSDLVQPVLQWGISRVGGGNHWAIANWYIDSSGHLSHSNLCQVQPGDVLTGMVSLTKQNNGSFSYLSSFVGYPALDLSIDEIGELVWAALTLEAYRIGQCSEFPDTPKTSMSSISIAAGGAAPPVMWLIKNVVTDCGESSAIVDASNPGGQVDIHYGF